jgi:hypothetical protein
VYTQAAETRAGADEQPHPEEEHEE